MLQIKTIQWTIGETLDSHRKNEVDSLAFITTKQVHCICKGFRSHQELSKWDIN